MCHPLKSLELIRLNPVEIRHTVQPSTRTLLSATRLCSSASLTAVAVGLLALCSTGCDKKSDPAAEAPPAAQVVDAPTSSLVRVDHPDQFPLANAVAYQATSSLNVTGAVNPDASRTIPVISLASGRVVALHVHVGDFVTKGQVLMEVSSDDISSAYSTYHKAVADEVLANTQLKRAQLLYDKGAIPKSQLEIAQDTEDKAVIDVQTAREHLLLLGVKKSGRPAGADRQDPCAGDRCHHSAKCHARRACHQLVEQCAHAAFHQLAQQFAESIHDRRPFACLDHLRRV